MTAPLTIVAHPADPVAVTARRADRVLEGHGVHVSMQKTESGDMAVWLVGRGNQPGRWFLPGQQLIVSHDGWRIEDVAGPEVAA